MAGKKKRMTQREKAFRAEVKKELQAQGRIPPNKPPLNRKKFAQEVLAEFKQMDVIRADFYLRKAIACMVSPDMRKLTSEEVGVLKLIKIALETSKFMEALTAEGRTEYTIGEYADKVIIPILNL